MADDPRVPGILQELRTVKGLRHEPPMRQQWCVPAAIAIAGSAFGLALSQQRIATEGQTDARGTVLAAVPRLLRSVGLASETYREPTIDIVADHIDRGEPLIAMYPQTDDDIRTTARAEGWSPYHAIVIGGYASRRALVILDPQQPGPWLVYEERLAAEWPRIAVLYGVRKTP